MNKYIELNRLEFVITNYCTGRCKHCSNGEIGNKESIDTETAVKIVDEIAKVYSLNSIMTFGGEPLLHAETVCRIHETAYKNRIENRDIITNGYFSKNYDVINSIAQKICNSNISEIMLSVDAFHQESIPIEPVIHFAKSLINNGFKGLRTHPAWLIDKNHNNSYNEKTKEILNIFKEYGIEPSEGNNIFPAGNAPKYLSQYFQKPDKENLFVPCGTLPYTGKIDNINCIGIDPNGDIKVCYISIGNIYKKSILEIIKEYDPYSNLHTKLIAEGGIKKLYDYLIEQGMTIDIDDCYSSCMVCHKIMQKIKEQKV